MAELILSAIEAERAWAERVRANREQVDRFREVEDGADFYGSVATMFRDDPHRTDEPGLDALLSLVKPGERWLDIGAGGGRYALPLALRAGRVLALDPSAGMLAQLTAGMDEHAIANVEVIQARWPVDNPPFVEVAFIAHVGYDIENIGPFLVGMEASARRLCVAMLFERRPTYFFDQLWPEVHGEARAALPALPELLALLLARGRIFEVRLAERVVATYESIEQAVRFARRQTWVRPGSAKDRLLEAAVERSLSERDGRYAFSWEPGRVGIVSWAPG